VSCDTRYQLSILARGAGIENAPHRRLQYPDKALSGTRQAMAATVMNAAQKQSPCAKQRMGFMSNEQA
jgi:hypothetical protein